MPASCSRPPRRSWWWFPRACKPCMAGQPARRSRKLIRPFLFLSSKRILPARIQEKQRRNFSAAWAAVCRLPSQINGTRPLPKNARSGHPFLLRTLLLRADSHSVERTVHKEDRDREERQRQNVRQPGALVTGQRDSQFDCQQSEERRELDDRVHGYR